MRKRLKEAIDYYIVELKRRFPAAQVKEMPEAMGGFDVWLHIGAPGPQTLDVIDATAELDEECYHKFSVGILATVVGNAFAVPPSGKLRGV